jgi:N-acetylneuraminic acid mutarotase
MKKFLQLLPLIISAFSGTAMAQAQATHEGNGLVSSLVGTPLDTKGARATEGPTTCIDAWAATSTNNAPLPEDKHTAVWTGSEMIVWGGETDLGLPPFGGRYNPGTDSWTTTSTTNAPTGRYQHTAVWTGTEMIVWGGYDGSTTDFNTGGRYNPNTNSWTATSTTNAPTGRSLHTAIWTGTEMIVWGGYSGNTILNSGGRYNPTTDTWSALTTNNAPSGRAYYSAVWAGNKMIVWGGYNGSSFFGDGGIYNPTTNTWTATSLTNAPLARAEHTAIWTGSEMIVWGGYGGSDLNTGGKYDPNTNTWTSTSIANAPAGSSFASGIWTGSEMIVWGGYDATIYHDTGGRYIPATNAWTPTTTNNAPVDRAFHTGVWTGNQMIVWGGSNLGGFTATGGRYCAQSSTSPTPTPPHTPTPTPTPTATPTPTPTPPHTPSPTPTPPHTPTPTPTIPPTPTPTPTPFGNTCGWSTAPAYPVEVYGAAITSLGGYIYAFGGTNSVTLNNAYKFDGVSWTAIAPLPVAESGATAVNDGTNIYLVGSHVYKYDPVANTYTQRAQFNVATTEHSAACLGGKIYKMCGVAPGSPPTGSNALEIYDIATNTWTPGADCPYGAASVTAFTFGNFLYIAGGIVLPPSTVNYAYRYDPTANAWDDSIPYLPGARFGSPAAAYGNGVVLAGGSQIFQTLDSALFWDSVSNQWLNLPNMLAPRSGGGAVLNGSFYVIGGNSDSTSSGSTTNQRLSCTSLPTPTPTPTPPHTPTPTPTPSATPTPTASPSATPATTPSTLGNISTRLRVETGDNVLIGGFIVTGTQSKRVIVRAIGPSLPFAGVLTDPFLELRDASGTLIRANDNWRDEQESEIMATTIPPGNDLESAIVATLPANGAAYTATVSGMNNGTGIGVVEVYDLNQAVNSKLANISTRGLVQTGDNVLIGGLIVLGQNPLRVILRAIGPSLPVQGALADPMLELRDGNGELVAANDNWRSDQETEIIATTIAPTNDLESAIVRNLAPGNYTGIVSGIDNTTGVGLVEAYHLSN